MHHKLIIFSVTFTAICCGLLMGENKIPSDEKIGRKYRFIRDAYLFKISNDDDLYVGANYGSGSPAPFLPNEVSGTHIGKKYVGAVVVGVVHSGSTYTITRILREKAGGARVITFSGRIEAKSNSCDVRSDYLQKTWYVDSSEKVEFLKDLLSEPCDVLPQNLVNLKSLIGKIDAAWARGDIEFIKRESAAYRHNNSHDAGALSLGMFVALYCERDWKKADALRNEILRLCKTSKQRAAVTDVLNDTCDMEDWRKVAEDDELYANAITSLKSVFKDKFPGSECALLVGITFYQNGESGNGDKLE